MIQVIRATTRTAGNGCAPSRLRSNEWTPFCCVPFVAAILAALTLTPFSILSADYSCSNCFEQIDVRGGGCGVRADGSVGCWIATEPPILQANMRFEKVALGANHSCALISCVPEPGLSCPAANVVCWGDNGEGQCSPVPAGEYVDVTVGYNHSCGVTIAGSVQCWGNDNAGEATPPPPPQNSVFVAVTAGDFFTCALSECIGSSCPVVNALCWGSNSNGETLIPGLPQFTGISAGHSHACGVKTDGSLLCWGHDTDGKTSPPGGVFKSVECGQQHSCAVATDGVVACWGDLRGGLLDPPDSRFDTVSAGTSTSCGVRQDRALVCWGNNLYGTAQAPAGLCAHFRGDFEDGGDCRWSSAELPCWTPDCDHDGQADRDAQGRCVHIPAGVPAECPTGTWTSQPPECGAYDCHDGDADVYSGQTGWFSHGYAFDDMIVSNLFDYNCDGVEEKRYTALTSSVCCIAVGGACNILVGLPECNQPGWDSSEVVAIPDCGQTASFRTCVGNEVVCLPGTVQQTQTCR